MIKHSPGISGSDVSTVKILLVEDHAILREGLAALLSLEADLEIVGAVGDKAAALQAISELKPRLVLTDLGLPDCTGMDLIGQLRACCPELRLLVLTAHNEDEYIRAALHAGAHGYVLKDSGRTELLAAIRAVNAGQHYLCGAVASKVVSGFVSGSEPERAPRPEHLITGREREVITRIALGQSNKVMARELSLSVKTIEKHRANLMRKLTLHNAAAITLFALRKGFINRDSIAPGVVAS